MKHLVALFFLFAHVAAAQDYPAHFTVTNVVDPDRLNIRSAPSARADIIGDYSAYTVNIEVLGTTEDGSWGKVGIGERNGWVAMRFLARSNHQRTNEFPRPMSCGGLEPSWQLNVTTRGDEFRSYDTQRRDIEMTTQAAATGQGYIATFQEGPTLSRTLIVRKGICNDTMSDREFGWKATLFNEAPDGNSLLTGCCTLDAN